MTGAFLIEQIYSLSPRAKCFRVEHVSLLSYDEIAAPKAANQAVDAGTMIFRALSRRGA